MQNGNILDDNLEHIDKPLIRTERIQQVETAAIVGSMASLALQAWNIALYGIFSFILLGGFVAHLIVLVALVWWRKISIEYDASTTTVIIFEPKLLSIFRIMIPLYSGWVILGSLGSIIFFLNYLSESSAIIDMDWSSYILRMLFSISMAFLYIYYWRITNQFMKFYQ